MGPDQLLTGLIRPGLTVPTPCSPSGDGGPTRGQARGPTHRSTSRGYVVPATTPVTPEQRIVEAAVLLPPGGAVTGWAGLRWWGGIWFDGVRNGATLPVALAGRTQRRHQPGLVWSRERLESDHVMLVDGLPVTTPAWSVAYEMRHAATLVDAVRALDLACYSDLVSIDDVRNHLDRASGASRIRLARAAVELADENCWSPQEAELRLLCELLAHTSRLLTNRPVFDLTGRHLITPDLLDLEAGLAFEYNGGDHGQERVRRRDRDREEHRQAHRLPSLTIMVGDPPGRVAERMRAALRTARSAAPTARTWTVEPPPWWRPTHTVAQRRALSAADRRRLLGHRRRLPPLISVVPAVAPVTKGDGVAPDQPISAPNRHPRELQGGE